MKKCTLSLILLVALSLFSCKTSSKNDHSSDTDVIENSQSEQTMETSKFGGVQLYTVRDIIFENPKKTLKEISDIGYSEIEAANFVDGKFYGMTPAEFKSYLSEIELTPIASHHGDINFDNMDEIIDACKEVGFKYIVIPIPPMGHFSYNEQTKSLGMSDNTEEIMDIINKIAARCHEKGIACLYHNHDMEFKPNSKGIIPMDYFIENSNPEHLNFELDLYWAEKAGESALDWFEKAPERFKAWHVKDMDDEGRFAPVGEGHINFHEILAKKDQSGMENYFVEQDQTFNHSSMEAIKISHNHLQEIGFH